MFKISSQFDKLLEKATNHRILEPELPDVLQMCDLIRAGECPAKQAVAAIKKKMFNANPHTAQHTLKVLESIMKNCGHVVHDEVATKAFMDSMRDLLKTTQHDIVKQKALELLQTWAHAFRSTPKYKSVQDIVTTLKADGFKFPAMEESDAMFSADSAPEWRNDEECHHCRVGFSVIRRKHHCRACGHTFCYECSSKSSTLPQYGIEKEVRVCDTCYEAANKNGGAVSRKLKLSLTPRSKQTEESKISSMKVRGTEREQLKMAIAISRTEAEAKHKDPCKKKSLKQKVFGNRAVSPAKCELEESLPDEYVYSSLAQQTQAPKTAAMKDEEAEREELELALALSQSEAEAKEREKKRATAEIISAAQRTKTPTFVKDEEDSDPEMARYLNRAYWEQKQGKGSERSGQPLSPDRYGQSPPSAPESPTHQHVHNGMSDVQLNSFVTHLRGQLEMFVNRMKSNSSRGRSISSDSSVQSLFINVTNHHSKLLEYIHEQDDLRVYYEGLQDKLAQVKDAMGALEALREEHQDKLRREAEEAERQKQLQMAQKLQIMRKKKQQYLEQQRQMAIHRVQEQEREMQMRKEQQKHQYLMGYMAGPYQKGYLPQGAVMLNNIAYLPPGYPMQHGLPPGAHHSLPHHMQQMGHPQMSGPPMSLPPNIHQPGQQQSMPQGPQGMQQAPHGLAQGIQQGTQPQGMPMGPQMSQQSQGMSMGQQVPQSSQGMPMGQQVPQSSQGMSMGQQVPQSSQGMSMGPQMAIAQSSQGMPMRPQITQGMPLGPQMPPIPQAMPQGPPTMPQAPAIPFSQQGIPPVQHQPGMHPGLGPQQMMPGYPGVQHHPSAQQHSMTAPSTGHVPQMHPSIQPGAPQYPPQESARSPEQTTAELIRFD